MTDGDDDPRPGPDQKPAASRPCALHAHDHGACVERILAEADALAKAKGARFTPVRRRTLEILLESHVALGAYEVLRRLDEDGFGAQPPVAYRALDFLVSHGFAHRIERLNAFVACAHPAEGHDPIFMICRSCHIVAEAVADPAERELDSGARAIGFEIERRVIEAEGLCPKCRETPDESVGGTDG